MDNKDPRYVLAVDVAPIIAAALNHVNAWSEQNRKSPTVIIDYRIEELRRDLEKSFRALGTFTSAEGDVAYKRALAAFRERMAADYAS